MSISYLSPLGPLLRGRCCVSLAALALASCSEPTDSTQLLPTTEVAALLQPAAPEAAPRQPTTSPAAPAAAPVVPTPPGASEAPPAVEPPPSVATPGETPAEA